MTFKLLAVSAALIGVAVTGAVIPGICDEAVRATPVVTAAASQQAAPDFTGRAQRKVGVPSLATLSTMHDRPTSHSMPES